MRVEQTRPSLLPVSKLNKTREALEKKGRSYYKLKGQGAGEVFLSAKFLWLSGVYGTPTYFSFGASIATEVKGIEQTQLWLWPPPLLSSGSARPGLQAWPRTLDLTAMVPEWGGPQCQNTSLMPCLLDDSPGWPSRWQPEIQSGLVRLF